ncbi:MAG TPA: CorA family divalent cation transporter [Gaiellaceae bacterium]|nr:CorA family divalent cation transporter [Gaiellaceae bacterium]
MTALLFRRDEVDEVEDWPERLPRLGRTSFLWIDLERPDEEELESLVEQLELTAESAELLAGNGVSPHLGDYGRYLHVTAFAPTDPESTELTRVTCLVSENWVVTVHAERVDVLDTFRGRTEGSGDTGQVDGPEFLATLLEWVVQSYLEAFEAIERSLEEIDAQAMGGEVTERGEALRSLVELRRRIGRLRRALVSHREPILALSRPELEAVAGSRAAKRFAALGDRLEAAVQAARDSRESVVGSFDLLIASTGQRTNEIMKVLTLASVLLLPGTLIAGVMGMNFRLGLFRDVEYFWATLGAVVVVAALTLTIARVRDWV